MTDWNDIGSICRSFGEQRSRLNVMLANRIKPGRNYWKEAADEIERLRTERLKLDRRIHNQRRALRENWEIIEMRAQYKRAWYPSKLLTSMLRKHCSRPAPWWRRILP